jgi:hypothetical protein
MPALDGACVDAAACCLNGCCGAMLAVSQLSVVLSSVWWDGLALGIRLPEPAILILCLRGMDDVF